MEVLVKSVEDQQRHAHRQQHHRHHRGAVHVTGQALREKLRELQELRAKQKEVDELLATRNKHQNMVEKSMRWVGPRTGLPL